MLSDASQVCLEQCLRHILIMSVRPDLAPLLDALGMCQICRRIGTVTGTGELALRCGDSTLLREKVDRPRQGLQGHAGLVEGKKYRKGSPPRKWRVKRCFRGVFVAMPRAGRDAVTAWQTRAAGGKQMAVLPYPSLASAFLRVASAQAMLSARFFIFFIPSTS